MYLKRAVEAYQKAGGTVPQTGTEKKKAAWEGSVPAIRKLTLEIGGFFKGSEIRTVLLGGNEPVLWIEHPLERDKKKPEIRTLEQKTRDAFLGEFRKIGIEKWKKQYRNDFVLDGESWEFSIGYEDGKTVKYNGSNAYPSGFGRLCALMGRTGDEE